MKDWIWTRRKKPGKPITLKKYLFFAGFSILLSIFAGLVVGEIFCRFFLPPELLIADPYLGSSLRPNTVYPVSEMEKQSKPKDAPDIASPFPLADEKINRWGWHDRDWPKEKKEGAFRIVFLGDSYTEGRGIHIDCLFTSVAKQTIGLPHVETLNMGQCGQGTLRSLVTYKAKSRPFQPDLVVLSFFMNDVNDNVRDRTLFHFEGPKPVRYTDSTGLLHIPLSWKSTIQKYCMLWYKTANRIAAYRASKVSRAMLQENHAPVRDGDAFLHTIRSAAERTGINILQEPYNDRTLEAWEYTFAMLSQLKEECAADGVEFALVVIPAAGQLVDPASERSISRKPIEFMQQYGWDHGVPVLDLSECLTNHFPDIDSAWFWGPSHWTKEAHRIVGETIGNWLKTAFPQDLAAK